MNIGQAFTVEPDPVVVHYTAWIFHHHSDARVAVFRAFDIHNVENVLLAPVGLRRNPKKGSQEKEIHQHVRQMREIRHIESVN